MDSEYQYQPLPVVSQHERAPPYSRVLVLAPGEGETPLTGDLELLNLDSPHRPYEALSYTWGTEPPSSYLWLNGQPIPIRPNLEAALTWLRFPNQHRVLWIDALCINQNDIDERSRQVSYMRLVYKFAARVVVWLGLKTEGVDVAFETARRLCHVRDIAEDQKRMPGRPAFEPGVLEAIWESALEGLPPDSMQRLRELLHRPYFERTWCVQEVAAASECIVRCEELEIPCADLVTCIFTLAQMKEQIQHNPTELIWWQIWDMKGPAPALIKSRVEGSLGTMLDVMDTMRGFKATDPRDKIFALQGICDEGLEPALSLTQIMGKETALLRGARRGLNFIIKNLNNPGAGQNDFGRPVALTPNYRKPMLDVYVEFTRFMMRRSPRVLNVLDHVAHLSPPGQDGFPTWVPKWFEQKPCLTMKGYYTSGFCKGHFRYHAEVHDNPLVGPAQNPLVLSIDGFKADVVQGVSEAISYETADMGVTIGQMERYWSQLFPFPLTPHPQVSYRDGRPLDFAFCLALGAHPFGEILSLFMDNSMTGVDLGVPQDFEQDVRKTLHRGEESSASFLEHLNRVRVQGIGKIEELDAGAVRFLSGARTYSQGRRLFVTHDGRIGLGPRLMQAGDEIVVLFGGRMPFVVRPRPGHHLFIGQCHLVDDELMQGKITERILRPKGGPPGPPRFTFHFR